MEPDQPQNKNRVTTIIAILLVLGAGYALFRGYGVPTKEISPASAENNNGFGMVTVENTPLVGGVLVAPPGFPQDIPIETGKILDSATTRYPEQNAEQLSVSYQSLKTVAQKFAEYKDYMNRAGYSVTEGDAGAPTRTLFGAKDKAGLSVTITSSGGKTVVQLSYLIKSL